MAQPSTKLLAILIAAAAIGSEPPSNVRRAIASNNGRQRSRPDFVPPNTMPVFEIGDTGDAVRARANVDAAARQGFDKTRWLGRDFDDGGIVGQHGEDR